MASTYTLGPLAGNTWMQYSNAAGQVYYLHAVSQEPTYTIPTGWEDTATVSNVII